MMVHFVANLLLMVEVEGILGVLEMGSMIGACFVVVKGITGTVIVKNMEPLFIRNAEPVFTLPVAVSVRPIALTDKRI
jgi:hypothetical protein